MKLEGTVEHVIYENADSGYAVFEVDAGGTDVVVAGNVGGVDNGMSVTVYGHMVNHPSYGEQFRAETIEARLPEDRTAILSYLSSGVLPYIGPSTAKKIVAKFGDDTLTVIAETPQRLCELKGITEQKAAIISNEFRRMYGVREVVAWFARYGMTAQQAVTCYRALGPHTVEALTQNPYLLCGEPLQLKFGQVDTIAAALQFETGCRLRVAAGLLYALRHNAGNGHTCLPRDKLLESTSKFLRLPLGDLEAALDELLSSEELRTRTFDGVEYIYLPDLLSAEEDIAARPVGAHRATRSYSASYRLRIALTVVVLPVPGPPVSTMTRLDSARRMACRCSGAYAKPCAISSTRMSASSVSGASVGNVESWPSRAAMSSSAESRSGR